MDKELRSGAAIQITWRGFWVNSILTVGKLVAGIIGHSSAMIADSIHSLSDFATDLVVVYSFKSVNKPADSDHRYGHGKYETMAALLVSIMLFLVGCGLLYGGVIQISKAIQGEHLPQPGWIALFFAFFSIIVKEILYRYTIKVGRRISSQAVIANAWHHRSDAFSSIGTAFGIGGAILLGDHWTVLDPLAAIIVSALILKVSLNIFWDTIHDLLEGSLSPEEETQIINIISGINGVKHPHNLKTRKVGDVYAIDIHIRVDARMNIVDAHNLATRSEQLLKERFGPDTIVSVHEEPDLQRNEMDYGMDTDPR